MHLRKNKLRLSDLPYICFYCGDPAAEREHVYPKSVFGERGYKVWSCRECNLLAGAKIFETIEDKAYYIQGKLQYKYRKLYDYPDWDEDELMELKGRLRQMVRNAMERKSWIRKRLRWRTSIPVMLVTKYLENLDIGRDFVAQDAANNGIRHSELTSLIEL